MRFGWQLLNIESAGVGEKRLRLVTYTYLLTSVSARRRSSTEPNCLNRTTNLSHTGFTAGVRTTQFPAAISSTD